MKEILVVEDDEMLCQAMVSLFKRNGYTVHSASSGNQAIKLLSSTQGIDLILSDYFMPDGDGRKLLEYVKGLPGARPVFILITGQTDLSAREMKSLGADKLLLKPIPTRDLVGIIERAIEAGATSSSTG